VRRVVVATKLDLGAAVVPESDAEEKACAFKAEIYETSAKDGAGIEELRSYLIQLATIVTASTQSAPNRATEQRRCC
jgi:selenocysteine-specific translation elongation factor